VKFGVSHTRVHIKLLSICNFHENLCREKSYFQTGVNILRFTRVLRKCIIGYDIFNCNWVATRWQLFSTHTQTNNTGNVTKQTIHETTQKYIEQHKKYIEQHSNYEECGPCPVFACFTLAFALQLRKKHGKTSVRVVKNI
jgi:hypothetical protein